MNNNEWLVKNLMETLRPLRDHAEFVKNELGTCGDWFGRSKITDSEWMAFGEAANRLVRDYKESPHES